jgi:hypothetical protein
MAATRSPPARRLGSWGIGPLPLLTAGAARLATLDWRRGARADPRAEEGARAADVSILLGVGCNCERDWSVRGFG